MREFTLEADLRLLSINKAFITLRNGSRARSKDYSEFALSICKLISNKRSCFKSFDDFFDYKTHELHAELFQYTNELYTKDGRLSKTSGDIGNMEKCLTDCILIGKIDDSAIVKWSLNKQYRDTVGFKVIFTIVDRQAK